MTRDHLPENLEWKRERSASRALLAGVLNWIAWAALIAAAMLSELVLVMALFFGVFFAIGSLITACLGLVAGFRGVRSDESRVRRKAWTGIALILFLVPALWAAATFGYGSQEWTEEVRLANGETILLRRHNRNGPGEFLQKCDGCISKATYLGEYRGRGFEWSTDRSTIAGVGPVALEFSGDDPILVFQVAGPAECESRGWPDPPFRVIRLEKRALLPDRWVDATIAVLPPGARVNLFELHRKNWAKYDDDGLLTVPQKDAEQGYDGYNLHPHGASLSAVGEWLNAAPDSCKSLRDPPSDGWLNSKRAVLDSEGSTLAIQAELIERFDEYVELSIEQELVERGIRGPVARTDGCRELGVRVATFGSWVVVPWPNPGGELKQADILVSPLPFDHEVGFLVLPGPLQDYRQILCRPGEILAVREKEPDVFLVTRLGSSAQKLMSRRIAINVPEDLKSTTAFWAMNEDGTEIYLAKCPPSKNVVFDGVARCYGGERTALLRYRIPW